ncbi:MAG: hypothetical protein QHG98_07280 [Methanothrix sp.]|jgi:hypothetical protein|nr:hypothetical protein [Methanothrix sp.]
MVAKTTRSRKSKGRAFQDEIRAALIAELGVSENDIISTPASVPGCDLKLSEAVRARFPFAIEAKRQERLRVWDAMKQCEANAAREGLLPLLVFRRNRETAYAMLRFSDFLRLCKVVVDGEKKDQLRDEFRSEEQHDRA